MTAGISKKEKAKYLLGIAAVLVLLLAGFLLATSKSSKEYQGVLEWEDGRRENVSFRLEYKNLGKLFNQLDGTLHLHLDSGWDYQYVANSEFYQLPGRDSQSLGPYEVSFFGPLESSRSREEGNPIPSEGVGGVLTAYFKSPGEMDDLALLSKGYRICSQPAEEDFREKVAAVSVEFVNLDNSGPGVSLE